MGLIKTVTQFFKVKSGQLEETLQAGNEIAFAKQELDKIKQDYQVSITNVAKVTVRSESLKADIKLYSEEIKQRTLDVKTLLTKKENALAQRVCARIELRQQEIVTVTDALKQQTELLKDLIIARDQLAIVVDDSENQLKLMETMIEVLEVNDSLDITQISSNTSALVAFKNRNKKLREQLAISKLVKQQMPEDLNKATDSILAQAPGAEMLAKIKTSMKTRNNK